MKPVDVLDILNTRHITPRWLRSCEKPLIKMLYQTT